MGWRGEGEKDVITKVAVGGSRTTSTNGYRVRSRRSQQRCRDGGDEKKVVIEGNIIYSLSEDGNQMSALNQSSNDIHALSKNRTVSYASLNGQSVKSQTTRQGYCQARWWGQL